MTVLTTTAKAGPYAGAGTPGPFAVPFRFLDATHLRVVRSLAGVDTVLALGTDYTVSGVGAGSGSVTLTAALPVGQTLTVLRNVPATQEADYVPGDAFPAESHEQALDKLTMITQQNAEALGRSLQLSPAVTGASSVLPSPEADKILGWNAAATALRNIDASTLATLVAYGTARADVFTGDGVQTVFTLSDNPASLNNLDVSVNGVTFVPNDDYTWNVGQDVTFTQAPPNGASVLIRYMLGLPFGTADASDVVYRPASGPDTNVQDRLRAYEASGGSALIGYTPAGTGAVATNVQSKLREFVSVKDFGAKGDGVTDDQPAIQLAIDYVIQNKKKLIFPAGTYLINQRINFGVFVGADYVRIGDFAVEGYGAELKAGPLIPYSNLGCMLQVAYADNFSIRGLKINGMCINPPSGITPAQIPVHNIQIYGCNDFLIADVTSIEARGDGIYTDTRNGNQCSRFQIVNCNISEASRNGISIVSGIDFVIANNIVMNTGRNTAIPMPGGPFAGLDIEEDPPPEVDLVTNGVVANNVFKNNLGDGVMNFNGANIIFDANIIIGNDGHGVRVGQNALSTNITNNHIQTSGLIGIWCEFNVSNILIEGNKILQSGACAIYVDNAARSTIVNNQIIDSACTAVAPVAYTADVYVGAARIFSNNYIIGTGNSLLALSAANVRKCDGNFIDNTSTSGKGIETASCQIFTNNFVLTNSASSSQGSIFLGSADNPTNYKIVDNNWDSQATATSVSGSKRVLENSAAPSSGAWLQGDIVYNNNPTAGGPIGWVCTTAGTPGTWAPFGHSLLSALVIYNPPNLTSGTGVTTTITVTGAALGDFAQASFSSDLQGITMTAWVSAANTVSVRFQNETGGAIDLSEGTLRARVRKL